MSSPSSLNMDSVPTSSSGLKPKPWYKEHAILIVGIVFTVIVISVVLGLVFGLGGSSGEKCGDQSKPTSGAVYEQCGGANPTGTITCDTDKGEWYCECGSGSDADLRTKDCSSDPQNPAAYCASGGVPSCGCGGAPFDSSDIDKWCKKGSGANAPAVAAICDYDTDDDNIGSVACQCGDPPSDDDDPDPLVVNKNACAGAPNSSWACVAPQGDSPERSGMVDCNCDGGSLLETLKSAFTGGQCTTGDSCEKPSQMPSDGNFTDFNDDLSSDCGCSFNCGSDGWSTNTNQ